MKSTIRIIGFCLVALAFLAAPAYANQVDVANTSGFGASILGPTTTVMAPNFSLTVVSQVFFNSSTGVYTYVYTLSNSTSFDPLFDFSVVGNSFSSTLNWGVVGTPTGTVILASTTFGTPAPFCGTIYSGDFTCYPALNFGFSGGPPPPGLRGTETITVYAQSLVGPDTNPGQPNAIAMDSDWTHGTVAAPVPEPGTMALFGSGMLGLAFAVRRRLLG